MGDRANLFLSAWCVSQTPECVDFHSKQLPTDTFYASYKQSFCVDGFSAFVRVELSLASSLFEFVVDPARAFRSLVRDDGFAGK